VGYAVVRAVARGDKQLQRQPQRSNHKKEGEEEQEQEHRSSREVITTSK